MSNFLGQALLSPRNITRYFFYLVILTLTASCASSGGYYGAPPAPPEPSIDITAVTLLLLALGLILWVAGKVYSQNVLRATRVGEKPLAIKIIFTLLVAIHVIWLIYYLVDIVFEIFDAGSVSQFEEEYISTYFWFALDILSYLLSTALFLFWAKNKKVMRLPLRLLAASVVFLLAHEITASLVYIKQPYLDLGWFLPRAIYQYLVLLLIFVYTSKYAVLRKSVISKGANIFNRILLCLVFACSLAFMRPSILGDYFDVYASIEILKNEQPFGSIIYALVNVYILLCLSKLYRFSVVKVSTKRLRAKPAKHDKAVSEAPKLVEIGEYQPPGSLLTDWLTKLGNIGILEAVFRFHGWRKYFFTRSAVRNNIIQGWIKRGVEHPDLLSPWDMNFREGVLAATIASVVAWLITAVITVYIYPELDWLKRDNYLTGVIQSLIILFLLAVSTYVMARSSYRRKERNKQKIQHSQKYLLYLLGSYGLAAKVVLSVAMIFGSIVLYYASNDEQQLLRIAETIGKPSKTVSIVLIIFVLSAVAWEFSYQIRFTKPLFEFNGYKRSFGLWPIENRVGIGPGYKYFFIFFIGAPLAMGLVFTLISTVLNALTFVIFEYVLIPMDILDGLNRDK